MTEARLRRLARAREATVALLGRPIARLTRRGAENVGQRSVERDRGPPACQAVHERDIGDDLWNIRVADKAWIRPGFHAAAPELDECRDDISEEDRVP